MNYGLALCALLLCGGDEVELVTNGGFEDGLSGWRALDMSGGARFEVDGKVRAEGRASLRIEKEDSGGRPDFLKQSAQLLTDAGTVRFSAQYRLDDAMEFEIHGYFFDAEGETLGAYSRLPLKSRAKRFEEAELELEVPRGATGFGINVMLRGAGTLWIDEFRAVHALPEGTAAPAAGVLGNAGFEEGLDGWTTLERTPGFRPAVDGRRRAEGRRALKLQRKSARLFPLDGVEARVALPRGVERARLTWKQRADGDARPSVCLQALGAGPLASARADEAGADEFTGGALELELPPEAAELRVRLGVGGKGTVWYDELVLELDGKEAR